MNSPLEQLHSRIRQTYLIEHFAHLACLVNNFEDLGAMCRHVDHAKATSYMTQLFEHLCNLPHSQVRSFTNFQNISKQYLKAHL